MLAIKITAFLQLLAVAFAPPGLQLHLLKLFLLFWTATAAIRFIHKYTSPLQRFSLFCLSFFFLSGESCFVTFLAVLYYYVVLPFKWWSFKRKWRLWWFELCATAKAIFALICGWTLAFVFPTDTPTMLLIHRALTVMYTFWLLRLFLCCLRSLFWELLEALFYTVTTIAVVFVGAFSPPCAVALLLMVFRLIYWWRTPKAVQDVSDNSPVPQESPEDAEERAQIMADLKALKENAVHFYHPELPVKASDPCACGRNYFSRFTAPASKEEEERAQEFAEEIEERNRILDDVKALKFWAGVHMHPERIVVSTDTTACGRKDDFKVSQDV